MNKKEIKQLIYQLEIQNGIIGAFYEMGIRGKWFAKWIDKRTEKKYRKWLDN